MEKEGKKDTCMFNWNSDLGVRKGTWNSCTLFLLGYDSPRLGKEKGV